MPSASDVGDLPGFSEWIAPIESHVWFYSCLIKNITGDFVFIRAYYENDTFADQWETKAEQTWLNKESSDNGAELDTHGSVDEATSWIEAVLSEGIVLTDTISASAV